MAKSIEDDDQAARLDPASAALVDAYLDHLRIERRLSMNTVEAYARDLTHLGRFAAGAGIALTAVDRAGLEQFVREMMGSGLAPRVDSPGLGLGLGLIAQVADSADVRAPKDGGTEVVMRFAISRAA